MRYIAKNPVPATPANTPTKHPKAINKENTPPAPPNTPRQPLTPEHFKQVPLMSLSGNQENRFFNGNNGGSRNNAVLGSLAKFQNDQRQALEVAQESGPRTALSILSSSGYR
jgi:hypothetical protein